jgi:hypothetical protein
MVAIGSHRLWKDSFDDTFRFIPKTKVVWEAKIPFFAAFRCFGAVELPLGAVELPLGAVVYLRWYTPRVSFPATH